MESEFKVPSLGPLAKTAAKKPSFETVEEDHWQSSEKAPQSTSKEDEDKQEPAAPSKQSSNCPYVRPKWSRAPDSHLNYCFEILKGGQIIEKLSNLQSREFWAIGKLPDNDIIMSHPTISRYHAVLQYRPEIEKQSDESDEAEEAGEKADAAPEKPKVEKGWYLYDLSSTHGSFVNKMRVPAKTFIRVRVGYMLKFGASTRSYILQGPDADAEAESTLSVTEIKELRVKKEQELREKIAAEEKKKASEGVSWGMTEDAEEETDLSYNPYAVTTNEELFLEDPKKTLRGYFEREGHDLDYKVDELAPGSFICKIELPIDDAMGNSIIAEFRHKGKKKDCVVQCALEACRILDRHGVLRQSHHEPQRKRKAKASDDDDDDEFYDRTREAEERRKQKSEQNECLVMTYDQLCAEELRITALIKATEENIAKYQERDKIAKQRKQNEDEDLDDFMSHLSSEKELDKTEIKNLRFERQRLAGELTKTRRLINITRPVEMPALKAECSSSGLEKPKKTILPLFGKKRTFGLGKPLAKPAPKVAKVDVDVEEGNVEEFDEDEEASDKGQVPREVAASTQATEEEEAREEETNKRVELEVERQRDETKPVVEAMETETETETVAEPADAAEEPTPPKEKKKRNRVRVRNDRNRDIDGEQAEPEDYVEPEKYSKWVPPENQSGDGFTELNAKYGY